MAEENLSEALAQIRLDNEKNTNQAMELGLTNQAILSSQEGTKIESWFWFYKDKPADLDKENCS